VSRRFLLDANVLSEPLKPQPNSGIMAQLQQHDTEIATAAPVWHELLFGCFRLPRSRRRRVIQAYLLEAMAPTLPILAYDAPAAAWHARERARQSAIGMPAPFVDGQIAAIAGVHGLILVTANTADFAAFQGLDVMDWRSAS
jgi:tRNA(fMet)-specific endonuclease VapC